MTRAKASPIVGAKKGSVKADALRKKSKVRASALRKVGFIKRRAGVR